MSRADPRPTRPSGVAAKPVDLLCMGRLTVDLYGEQRHTSLGEARSFRRYPGGSSGNVALGAARLGVRTALVTTVGNDPMGDYLINALEDEGVAADMVRRAPERRTALAFLGMLDAEAVNLDFYRALAADEAIRSCQVPQDRLDGCRVLAVTGTMAAASDAPDAFAIVERALAAGVRLVVDIDFRRAIWQTAPGGLDGARSRVRRLLDRASLVVGNEEEFQVIGNTEDLTVAVEQLRAAVTASLVVKLGARGAMLIDDASPATLAEIPVEPGFTVDVANPVGAGDAFLAGFLASWLEGEPPATALRNGNACGALVVSRHGCSAASPYRCEIDRFIKNRDLREASELHRLLGRRERRLPVYALACDHRVPFEDLMAKHGRDDAAARRFKSLVVEAVAKAAPVIGDAMPGVLLDEKFGARSMRDAAAHGFWLGRPVEVTGSRPLAFEPGCLEAMRTWSPGHIAKCLVWHHPDDSAELRDRQFRQLARLQATCQANEIEWMLELVPPLECPRDGRTMLRSMDQVYDAGLRPDWWKLPGFEHDAEWKAAESILARRDRFCRGVVMLGLNEMRDDLRGRLVAAGRSGACAGFAIGRTIFADVAEAWFAGTIPDEDAVGRMHAAYRAIMRDFESGRG